VSSASRRARCAAIRLASTSSVGRHLRTLEDLGVKQQHEAYNGDIVAAMIDEEATVKVYRRRAGHVVLEARNPAYENIDGDRAVVLGKVVSVLRRT